MPTYGYVSAKDSSFDTLVFPANQKKAIVTYTITEVITGHTDRCFWREAKLNNNTPS